MPLNFFGKLTPEPLSPDDLYFWRASGLLDLRVLTAASKLLSTPWRSLVKKISQDTSCRDQCIEVLKALDAVEWAASRRAALAQQARENIKEALAACNVRVTNQMLSRPMDHAALALTEDICADEVNAVSPLQSGREAIYQAMDDHARRNRLGSA